MENTEKVLTGMEKTDYYNIFLAALRDEISDEAQYAVDAETLASIK